MSTPNIDIGTKVTLSKNSRWWNDGCSNPIGITGVVVRNYTHGDENYDYLPYQVRWANGQKNAYKDQDLKVLGQGYNLGEIYVNIHGDVHSLGKVGTFSGIVIDTYRPLYVGDLLKVTCLKTGEVDIRPLIYEGGHFYIWGYGVRSQSGNWDGQLKVEWVENFDDVGYTGSWSNGRLHWCKELVEGLPTW